MLDESLRLGFNHFGIECRNAVLCEWEAYATACLLARMEESSMEPTPIWCGDLADFDGKAFHGLVDCITAGFPCQPWSAAGKQQGTADERWLWPAIANIIRDVGPGFVFLENVPGLVSGGGLDHVLSSLAEMRFDAEWVSVTAEAVGAAHRRERVFILGYTSRAAGEWNARSIFGTEAASGSKWIDDGDLPERLESANANVGHTTSVSSEQRQRQRFSAEANAGRESGTEGSNETVADSLRSERGPRAGRQRVFDDGAELALPAERGQRELREPSECDGQLDWVSETIMDDSRHGATGNGATSNSVQPQQGSGRRSKPTNGSGALLADAAKRRSQNQCEISPQRRQSDVGDGSRIFAPGPSADWRVIPEYLWPATQPGFRLLVDGNALALDESRADQLRCGGNSVVAVQGAVAFIELMRRMITSKGIP